MYTVTKEIYFCYGHRLMDYNGPCKYLHGHNGKVEVELSRDKLDGRGMVVDFSEIREVIKNWIDQSLDHTMLLKKDDPLISVLKEQRERFYAMDENPTAESLARLIYDYARSKGFPVTRVTLWETESSFATYRVRDSKA